MLYEVVLSFESADEILKCDHSNESYWAVRFLCYVVVQSGSNFWSVDEILLKSVRQYFPVLDLRLSVSSQVTFSRQLPVNCLC